MFPIDRHTEDALVIFEVIGLFRGNAGRELQWRYAVGRDATPLDLKRLDARGLLVALQELLESGMDACEEAALELRVAVGRTVLVQVCAYPLEPRVPLPAEVLSCELLEREERLLQHFQAVDVSHERHDDGHHGLVPLVAGRLHPVDGQSGIRGEIVEHGTADALEYLGHREDRVVFPVAQRRGNGGRFFGA